MGGSPERAGGGDGLGRRAFLATGVVAALAGCNGTGDDGTATSTASPTGSPGTTGTTSGQQTRPGDDTQGPTTTDAPGGTKTADLGRPLTVGGAVVDTSQEFVTAHSVVVDPFTEVTSVQTAPAGRQYAFVGMVVSGETRPPMESWTLVVDGDPSSPFDRLQYADPVRAELPASVPYWAEQEEAFLGFEVPAPVPEGATVELVLDHLGSTGRWTVPPSRLAASRTPAPQFELGSVSAPESVRPGEQFQVTATIGNVGGTPGRAYVIFNHLPDGNYVGGYGPQADLDPGESATFVDEVAVLLNGEDVDRVDLAIRSSGGDRDLSIPVRSG